MHTGVLNIYFGYSLLNLNSQALGTLFYLNDMSVRSWLTLGRGYIVRGITMVILDSKFMPYILSDNEVFCLALQIIRAMSHPLTPPGGHTLVDYAKSC